MAMHGHGEEGIDFCKMLVEGFRPDEVNPTLKHYTCMVDLLSRAGQLDEAYKVVKKMPLEPDSVIWGALLGGCVIRV
ncbi:hypothetical protein LguiB_003801 [Lonicera macranthoides]